MGQIRRLELNTAQLRNLRNWPSSEWPQKTLTFLVRPSTPITEEFALGVVRTLVSRHEALRSRLVVDDRGALVQEILPVSGDADGDITWRCTDLPDGVADRSIGGMRRLAPDKHAVLAEVRKVNGLVDEIHFTVSHVFADALGAQGLAREAQQLVDGEILDEVPAKQASDYAMAPFDKAIQDSTDYWKAELLSEPRSCTYSVAAREEFETVEVAELALDEAVLQRVSEACRSLRITENTFWLTAISTLVTKIAGESRQVFKTTYANRIEPSDFGAVAQLAQAVYLPIRGTGDDTLRARASVCQAALLPMFDHGGYNANTLIDWLNGPSAYRGISFQPAFEFNYVPLMRGRRYTPFARNAGTALNDHVRMTVFEDAMHMDPWTAKPDLQVTLIYVPFAVLQIRARRPVFTQRDTGALLGDLLKVVGALCADTCADIATIDVATFPAVEPLLRGHRSGARISPEATSQLVTQHSLIDSCELEILSDGRLQATLGSRGSIDPEQLWSALRSEQPWLSGAAVPDEFVLVSGKSCGHPACDD